MKTNHFSLFVVFVAMLMVGMSTNAQTSAQWKRAESNIAAGKYKEAFDNLREMDHAIATNRQLNASQRAAEHYKVSRGRWSMYVKMRRPAQAKEHLDKMEHFAALSKDVATENDMLYNKAIHYYTFGQDAKGNVAFREMAAKLTASGDYDRVDEVYQTLIANGRRSGSANMVAQAYSGYVAWKDSTSALKFAAETTALKQQIADGQALIAKKDKKLSSRQYIIIGLWTLVIILAAILAAGTLALLRLLHLTRKQKKTIRMANESNALKAHFISNISAQLTPTLQKLDDSQTEVRALQRFVAHIQTLSELESQPGESVEMEDTMLPSFCEALVTEIKPQVRTGVSVTVDVPRMSAPINKEYVGHVLSHLLHNAVKYTPEDGQIRLEFKKRSAHKYQFLVSNTGSTIPEEQRENVFKPFLEVRDLTQVDGLELPICQLMAAKMNGEITIDPEFTKGTRFILTLEA